MQQDTTTGTAAKSAETPVAGPDAPLRLVVLIPAFNEALSIGSTIRRLRGIEPELARLGIAQSIYVVNDGSTDETGRLAAEAGAERVLRHRVNQGLGAAVRTGLRAAKEDGFDILVKFDADLQHAARDVVEIVQPILADEADLVYGDRFERIGYRMPLVRRLGNITFSRLMRWLTGWPLRDSQPGIFAAAKDYLDVSFIPGDYNYTQQVLLDAYHKNMRFAHVAVSFEKRETGKSFISLKYPFKVIPQILLIIASVRPLRIFFPLGAFFILLALAVFTVQVAQWFTGHAARPVENVNLVLGSFIFGVQTVFFGVLAQLIVQIRR